MAQIFHPSANTLSRVSLFGAVFLAGGLLFLAYLIQGSPYQTEAGVVRNQPVPFSHEHHVRGLGLDCRYCHTTVETSSFAGMPPTETCMTCHSQIWSDSPLLEPVRASLANNRPIRWNRVHDLPDFVYFHHGIHVQKGVGCASCHGPIDRMPLVWKDQPLTMEWCLECHRHPERFLRPREEVFNLSWAPPNGDQSEIGERLLKEHAVPKDRLTNCSVCHR
jgi:hypothetical protein